MKIADFGKTLFTLCVVVAVLWLFSVIDGHLYFLSLFVAGGFI